MIFYLFLALLIAVGPFAAVTPAVLAARINGPVFSPRRPVRPAFRIGVFA
jgi:hypothetical protein